MIRAGLVILLAIVLLPVLLVAGIAAPAAATASADAPLGAVGDIPAERVALYVSAARRFGIDWALLAGIGKIECDHGRSQLAGCNPPGTVNSAGATGTMQFLGPTWRATTPLGSVPPPGPPTTSTTDGYATDGDRDGIADVWNDADAITAAARYLHANGAPGDERRAIFAYNHAGWYVDAVLADAAHYRGLAAAFALTGSQASGRDPVAWAARYLGTAYVWGGNHGSDPLDPASLPIAQRGRDGRSGFFDCSSLTGWAFAKAWGIAIGGTAEEQWAHAQTTPGVLSGTLILPPGGFQRDDIIWTERSMGHVGIIATPALLLNAPRTGRDVSLDPISARSVYGWARYRAPIFAAAPTSTSSSEGVAG